MIVAHFNSQGDEGPLGPPGPAGLEVRIWELQDLDVLLKAVLTIHKSSNVFYKTAQIMFYTKQ